MLAASLSLHASCNPPVLFHHSIGSGNAKYKHSKKNNAEFKNTGAIHSLIHVKESLAECLPSAKERKGGIHTLLAL